ncbi:hypothetical protein JTB14_033597 [Gonioctena quinquepunctata]|nr:hypothetical protein JTB14_033597 [Gonioctena quinquepunctata]
MWRTVREYTGKKPKSKVPYSFVQEHGCAITGAKQIAESLNEYFSNVDYKMMNNTDQDHANGLECGRQLSHPPPSEEVVISGIGGVFPKARNVEELEKCLFEKLDLTTEHYRPNFDHPDLPKRSATINEGLEDFDCGFFGLDEHQSSISSPEMRILLEKTVEAIIDAGLNPEDIHNTRTNLYIAQCYNDSEAILKHTVRNIPGSIIRTSRFSIGMNIAHFLKLKGSVFTADTACSSSLHAIDHALIAIRSGGCENAIISTINIIINPGDTMEFAKLGVLSMRGICQPFDENGDGYVRSEAVCALLLQKAKNAKRIYAQLVHVKCNSDGFKDDGITFPSKQAQSNLMEEVFKESNISPDDITFMEAHATGTTAGDPEECAAIDAIIAQHRKTPLMVGSIKGNLGHSEPSAGVSSIVKCILSMEKGYLIPNVNYSVPRPNIPSLITGRIKVVQEATKINDEKPLMVVNSFGFGGSNGLAVLRAMAKKKVNHGVPNDDLPRLVCVSGRTPEGVTSLLDTVHPQALDVEYIALLHSAFKKHIPNHLYSGYKIISKTDVIQGSINRIPLRPSLYLVFGNLVDWFSIYKYFSGVPIFADLLNRVQKSYEKYEKMGNTVLSPDEGIRKSYDILGCLVIQLCLADLLKQLDLPTTAVKGYSLGELVHAYYDGDLDLEAVLSCGFMLNTKPSYRQINGYEDFIRCTNEEKGKELVKKIYSTLEKQHYNKRDMPEYLVDFLDNNESKQKEIEGNPLTVNIGKNMLDWENSWETNSFSFHSFEDLLHILGRLYTLGFSSSIEKLYPMVKFPVSRGTPMIAPKIKWNHQRTFVNSYEVAIKTRQTYFSIDLMNKDWKFISGHSIDGRILFPASGYLYLALITSIGLHRHISKYSITFENVRFTRATTIPPNGAVSLSVNVNYSGYFEIMEGSSLVVIGHISLKAIEGSSIEPPPIVNDSKTKKMNSKDIYKELRLRGYDYSGEFNTIKEMSLDATHAKIAWTGNWITFIDSMFQTRILEGDTRLLYVPTTLSRLTLTHQHQEKEVARNRENHSEERGYEKEVSLPVNYCPDTNIMRGGGVEIVGLGVTCISKRKNLGIPVLEKYEFIPNNTKLSTIQSVRVNMQIIIENTLMTKLKCVELIDNENQSDEILSKIVSGVFKDQPLIQGDIKIFCDEELDVDITVEKKKLSEEKECVLVIITKLSERKELLKEALIALRENGYIITRESSDFNDQLLDSFIDLSVQTMHRNDRETLILLRRSPGKKQTIFFNLIEDQQFTWLTKIQSALKTNQEIIIYSHKNPQSGLLGFFNCLRREPEGDNVRSVLIMDENKEFYPNDGSSVEQLGRGMAINVYQQGSWGTYRHLLLEKCDLVESEHCFVDQTVKANLSSLTWVEGPLRPSFTEAEKKLVKIKYSSLNFRDIMTATGKINIDASTIDPKQECGQGLEFSGIEESGQRVMGMVAHSAIATFTIADKHLVWKIPDDWSLADAASVPVVYGTVLYSLVVRGRMKRGDSILIHSGTGGVGQAAIRYALHHGCTVYTTVGNQEKKDFLKRLFPQLKERQIGNSRDQSFVKMIMRQTRGRGVDMVLNSLADDKLLASVRCLARGGRFLEIGKYDLFSNSPLNLLLLRKGASFHGISLDRIFHSQPTDKMVLGQLIMEGIEDGSIKPLGTTIFKRYEIEQAYRYMTKGIHMGKVLIEVCEEQTNKPDIRGIPRYYCDPTKSYVIIGGLGGLGLELADWLVERGAKKLVLTSRGGIKNGYQQFRIRFWRSYGVVVVISTTNVTQRNGCVQLIEEANEIGPIGGIFNLAVILQDAIFENQDAAMYETSLKPKAFATKYLDEVSRIFCPELSDFVVFSSVSCGRGNPGQTNYGMANSIMERICEKRRRDGLPALAIQWGAIGEVGLVAEMQREHKVMEIGGTLQQKVSSCMEVMDIFLRQKFAAVVSSMVVAEKKASSDVDSLVSCVMGIIGINDVKSVSIQATLAELGMDSMNGVEIRQALERDFGVFLSIKELRTLTIARLLELDEKRNTKSSTEEKQPIDLSQLKAIIFKIIPNESELSHDLIVNMKNDMDEEAPLVYLIPGIEGYAKSMESMAQQLHARTIALQFSYDNPPESMRDLALSYIPHMEHNLTKEKPFCIIAHSYGVCVGLEAVAILESKGYTGTLIMIDGTPEIFIDMICSFPDEVVFESFLMSEIIGSYSKNVSLSDIMPKLMEHASTEERIEYVSDILNDELPFSREFIKTFLRGLIKRFKALRTYKPPSDIRSKILLLKSGEESTKNVVPDWGLSKLFGKHIEVFTFEGDHLSILENVDLVKKIESFL